jgi:hypothetical protein
VPTKPLTTCTLSCRAIGQLQRLDTCILYGDSQPSSQLTPPVGHAQYLPVWSTKHLTIRKSALPVVVMWTQLPPTKAASLQLHFLPAHPAGPVRFDVPSDSATNRGWLDVLLRHQAPIIFYVTLRSNLGSLAPDLERYSQPLMLMLQCHVAPEVLGAAVAGYAGRVLALLISKPSSAGYTSAAELEDMARVRPEVSDAHLKALLPAMTKLEGLHITNCSALSSGAVAELVERSGDRLRRLSLSQATNVTDCTLGKLLQNCRKLHKVMLNGAPAVTEAGIALLLVHQQPRFYAELSGTSINWGKLKEVVEQQGGCCRVKHKGNVSHVQNSPDRQFQI